MTSWHAISLYSPTGVYLDQLRWKSIDVTLVERDQGTMTLGIFPEYSDALFQRDCRILYHRVPEGLGYYNGKMVGGTMWLVTGRERILDQHGQHTIALTCQHPNAILGRRVVAYDEGTPEADKSDVASDTCYDYIRENFVAATDTTRNLSTSHFVLDPRPATFGPSTPINGSYRNVLEILQDVTASAAAQGTYVGFEVYVNEPPGPFRCRLYQGLRGTNRGLSSRQTLLLSPAATGMQSARVAEDWGTIASFAYAGGTGKHDERILGTAEDTAVSGQSPFGRAEVFESFNIVDPTTGATILDSEAAGMLRKYRPRREFSGSISSNVASFADNAIYDVDYTWGDIVAMQFQAPTYFGGNIVSWETYLFDCRVNPVHLQAVRTYDDTLQELGVKETVEVTLQSVSST